MDEGDMDSYYLQPRKKINWNIENKMAPKIDTSPPKVAQSVDWLKEQRAKREKGHSSARPIDITKLSDKHDS